VTADLTGASSALVKFKAGSFYRTLPVSVGAGVSLDMAGSGLVAGTNLGGWSFASTLLTINAWAQGGTYTELTATCLVTGATGHKFNPTYWESNIGIKFTGAGTLKITFAYVAGWCIGAQFTGPDSIGYNTCTGGKFTTNKINVDLRTALTGFLNENNFHDVQIQSGSAMDPYGTLAGLRFSSDDDGSHSMNNNKFDGFSFEIGNHSSSYNWVSGTSKTQYSIYASAEKYWSFMSATASCGTDTPPATDTVTWSDSGGDLLGTFANFSVFDGMQLFLTNSGGTTGEPDNTDLYTWYWVVGASGKTFKLSLTKGGTPFLAAGLGSGTTTIEAQRYTEYTDNAGKLWKCDGVKFRAPVFVDDTGCSQFTVTRARWETSYGPFTHVQQNRRFASQLTNCLFEPYELGTTAYGTHGELNPSAAINMTTFPLFNVYRKYSTYTPRVFYLDNIPRRYIKSVSGHATIRGMAFLDRDAWDTIVQANATGNNYILCKDYLKMAMTGNWLAVVFVDAITHKKVIVSADVQANSQLFQGKPFDSNFKSIALNNFTKALCGSSRLQTGSGGYIDMVSNGNGAAYAVPNVAGSTTRYIMVALTDGSLAATPRGITFQAPEGEQNAVESPLRVCTPFGPSDSPERSSFGEPVTGWFMEAGEFIRNISTGVSDPLGWVVKTAGALAPAFVDSSAVILGELRVSDSGTKVYAVQTAGTCGTTDPTGTGTSISDGTLLWDYQCPVAVLEVVQRAAKFVATTAASATFAQHNLTGAQEVAVVNTTTTPGTLTTRTATEMVADMGGGASGSYKLRITNASANTLTLAAGSGVTLTGTAAIAANKFADYLVTIASATALTIQRVGTGDHV
jgi:hypothetical protein